MARSATLTLVPVLALSAWGTFLAPATAHDATAHDAVAQIVDARVEHGASALEHSVTWSLTTGDTSVRVEVSTDPEAEPSERRIVADAATGGAFTWAAEGDPARLYFTLTPEGGEAVQVAERVLPLEGGRNFRDLGGYETLDGRTVRWGHVYRSGVMSDLTTNDYDYLDDLGIEVVCDLRTSQERAAEPTVWAAGEIEYLTFPDPAEDDASPFIAVFGDPEVTPAQVADAMAQSYPHMAEQQAPAYREMFDRLAAGEVPLAFNCSAGKDRTGIGAALLLTALGVPRETVVTDYALSEQVVDYQEAFLNTDEPVAADDPYAFLRQLPVEIVAPLLRSDPRYLETALDAFVEQHGSVLAYIQSELDVTDEELAAIRAELLE